MLAGGREPPAVGKDDAGIGRAGEARGIFGGLVLGQAGGGCTQEKASGEQGFEMTHEVSGRGKGEGWKMAPSRASMKAA